MRFLRAARRYIDEPRNAHAAQITQENALHASEASVSEHAFACMLV